MPGRFLLAGSGHGSSGTPTPTGWPWGWRRGRGDQYVIVDVEIPKKLNRTQREALKAFEDSLKDENYEKRKSFFKNLKDRFMS